MTQLIEPLQKIVEVTASEEIERELLQYPVEIQQELLELVKELMRDEVIFVLMMYKHWNYRGEEILM
ncbi:hypothetical protein L1765_11165 [Microaerobacter geothermalis]|uniref:hypothetical protein n=1 Tax=Microaerobacter geothermalis TaxID=674972 RepID=UPI001F3C4DA8|nr:hypothetical protein [Microaerobacter geothermalis]MCF6094522.1 hypothetical protein [Microaerobacter geothermalis]